MLELAIVIAVAIFAGGVAALSGFGIGSLLTPLFALRVDVQLAVAAVSIPHLVATALRFVMIRQHLNKKIFISFGLWSAVGGLGGALLHNIANNPALVYTFASLLIFAGSIGLFNLSNKLRCPPQLAWLAGLASGAFGGLVGNQGGIRSAALLGFDLNKEEFVATATGIALLVDIARIPVYFVNNLSGLQGLETAILVAAIGVVIGTILGKGVLQRIPELVFKRTVSGIILALGISMLFRGQ